MATTPGPGANDDEVFAAILSHGVNDAGNRRRLDDSGDGVATCAVRNLRPFSFMLPFSNTLVTAHV